ncbi:hypothetical protein [Streptomyces platensis]|nr:hypothetical protein OG962_37145 [Streptomyces platensis]
MALEEKDPPAHSHLLPEVGRRMMDRLEHLRHHCYAVEDVVPYRHEEAERTIAAVRASMSDDLSNQLASIVDVHRLGRLASNAVSQFRDGVESELAALSEKVAHLYAGRTPSADMTPQMVCAVYAMGFTVSVAMGLAPSALMCAVGFLTNGCVGYLNPDP